MKKVIAFLMSACMLLPLASPVTAAENAVTEDVSTLGKYFKYSIDCLVELGLLRGTGGSLELDRTPTRAEAITMIVRLDGGEDEAKNCNYDHPFTDVPEWADGYIGYAYENGITKGISDTELGSDLPVTGQMYLTMVLRTLGYKDGGTYYGHSFTYDAPFELAEELGLLHAVYYRHYDSHDRPVFDINNEDYCIRERIQTVFNREYMSYITFNALTCLKIDEAPKVTLFEARHYEDTNLTDTRLYEIFRHKQVESDSDSAVIFSKPKNEYELRTQPYALTVNGKKYTLTGRNILKIFQTTADSWKYDSYCLPLFATLELLGIEYHFENDTLFVSYETLSPDVSNVTARAVNGKDKQVYLVDSIKYNSNGKDILTSKRIGGAIYDISMPSYLSIYEDSITVSYRGDLYIQINLLADILGMDTDNISWVYDESFVSEEADTTPLMGDKPYVTQRNASGLSSVPRPKFSLLDQFDKIPSTYYEEYPGLSSEPLTATLYKDGEAMDIDINDPRIVALVNLYNNSQYYGVLSFSERKKADQDIFSAYDTRLEITFAPNKSLPKATDTASITETCEMIVITQDNWYAVDQHLTDFTTNQALPHTAYKGSFGVTPEPNYLSLFGCSDVPEQYFSGSSVHGTVLSDEDWNRLMDIIPSDHYVFYPNAPGAPIAATLYENGEAIPLDITDPRIVRLVNLYNNAQYHNAYIYMTGVYEADKLEEFFSEKQFKLELIFASDSFYDRLWIFGSSATMGTRFVEVHERYSTGFAYWPFGSSYHWYEWLGF